MVAWRDYTRLMMTQSPGWKLQRQQHSPNNNSIHDWLLIWCDWLIDWSVHYSKMLLCRCVRDWQPHSGRPLSAIFFLDSCLHTQDEYVPNFLYKLRVPPRHGKSWNLGRPFSRPGKFWKIAKVMESHENSWKMIIVSCNFYRSCRSLRTANELVLDCCDICEYV